VARRLGLIPLLARMRQNYRDLRGAGGYERAFGEAIEQAIRAGDVVWDVGANVGFYTERFLQAVGETGRVVAFEPMPTCHAELLRRLGGLSRLAIHRIALAGEASTMQMALTDDPLGTTGRLVAARGNRADGYAAVRVERADALIEANEAPQPDVAKIDVEGYELDVLRGFGEKVSGLRALFIEVHFGLLERRGMRHAPSDIVSLLERQGFEVHWVDASHLSAIKAG
jgi:FkbM family methyltransferase